MQPFGTTCTVPASPSVRQARLPDAPGGGARCDTPWHLTPVTQPVGILIRRPGTTSDESAELKRVKRENAELRRANAILRSASVFFAAELDRPQR